MTDHSTNEEREMLIAGDRAGSLEPEEAAELALMADLLADPSTWVEPSAGLEEAVVQAVAHAEPPAAAPVTPLAAGTSRAAATRRRRLAASAVAVVAAAVIAIVVVVLSVTGDGTSADYEAQLSATALAPGAHASADITRAAAGFHIALDARGLRQLPADEYYQAWLKNEAGTLVPIGTFSSSDGGVRLWSGVSPSDFPMITVTIETVDNDQTSSGRRVLVGDVHTAD